MTRSLFALGMLILAACRGGGERKSIPSTLEPPTRTVGQPLTVGAIQDFDPRSLAVETYLDTKDLTFKRVTINGFGLRSGLVTDTPNRNTIPEYASLGYWSDLVQHVAAVGRHTAFASQPGPLSSTITLNPGPTGCNRIPASAATRPCVEERSGMAPCWVSPLRSYQTRFPARLGLRSISRPCGAAPISPRSRGGHWVSTNQGPAKRGSTAISVTPSPSMATSSMRPAGMKGP